MLTVIFDPKAGATPELEIYTGSTRNNRRTLCRLAIERVLDGLALEDS